MSCQIPTRSRRFRNCRDCEIRSRNYRAVPIAGPTVTSKIDQIDYLLISDALWPHLREVGIERRGIWAKAKKTRAKYPPLTSVTGDTNAASDHAVVWADFDL